MRFHHGPLSILRHRDPVGDRDEMLQRAPRRRAALRTVVCYDEWGPLATKDDHARFLLESQEKPWIFHYEQALELLMRCSLRRNGVGGI